MTSSHGSEAVSQAKNQAGDGAVRPRSVHVLANQ